jgi:16S rRNA processing protein RimM
MADYYNVGKVTSAHGIKGEVKVYPLTNVPKIISKRVCVKLKGIDNRDEAEKLKGAFLKVDSQNALKLEKDEYFIKDLIGMKVYTEEGDFVGSLVEVLQTGANDVYVIKGEEREILIPAIKEVVKKVDVDNKVMVVHLLEGL